MIWWLIGIAALIAALAVLPVDLICELSGRSLRLRLRWLGITYRISSKGAVSERKSKGEKPAGSHDTHFDPGVLWRHRQALLDAARTALDLTLRLVRSWHLKSGELSLNVGTGDPASTGMIYGGLAAAIGVFSQRWPQVQVDCQARFDKRIMELDGHLVFRARPGILVGHLMRAAFRLPWRGLWQLRRDYISS